MLKFLVGRRATRGVSLAAFVGLLAILEWAVWLRHGEQVAQQRLLALTTASELRAGVDRELNSLLNLTGSLAGYLEVKAEHGGIDDAEVEAMLANLYAKSRYVLNFGVAVGYRLTYVYPLRGNEKAIGIRYPDIPAQWPAVQRSIASSDGVLAGPVALVQGGTGLIYRAPIHVGGRYWGLMSTVIDAPALFRAALLRDAPQHFDFAVRGRDGSGEKGEVFLGEPHLFEDAASVLLPAEIPGGRWLYAVRLAPVSWLQPATLALHGLAVLISALLSYFVYQLQKSRFELAQAAQVDALTQLINRREFETVLEGALERRRKFDRGSFALLFLDLDHFKTINDNYGHDAGDAVLKTVAERLRGALRDDDVIGRWGGDELAVLVRNSSAGIVNDLLRRIRAAIAEPISFGEHQLRIGVAIGVANSPADGDSIAALFRAADECMYRDKQLNLLHPEQSS